MITRYIFKNIRDSVREHPLWFFVMIFTCIISSMIIFVAVGLMINNKVIRQIQLNSADSVINLEDLSSLERFSMHLSFDKEGSEVTKKNLDRCIMELIDRYEELSENKLKSVYVYTEDIDWGYKEKTPMELRFSITGSGISAPDIWFENERKYGSLRGAVWSDEEEKKGANVALFWDYSKQASPDESFDHIEDALRDDGNLIIQGREYDVIGYFGNDANPAPVIPYNSLSDDTVIKYCIFEFEEYMTENTYSVFHDVFFNSLGDKVVFEDENTTRRKIRYTYNTVLIIAVILIIISVIDYLILYSFFFENRKNEVRVFSLCGLSEYRLMLLLGLESAIILVVSYAVAVGVFHFFIKGYMGELIVYALRIFNVKTYVAVLFTYIVILLLFGLYRLKNIIRR